MLSPAGENPLGDLNNALQNSDVCSDRKAIVMAAACFVHCIAGPLLLSFAGFASLIGISERLEPVFLLTSIVLGGATLVPAYRKRRRGIPCLRRLHWTLVPEGLAVGIGAAMIIGAYTLNLKFSRKCACCMPSVAITSEEQRP